jgi:PAS domain S-box-containing protein
LSVLILGLAYLVLIMEKKFLSPRKLSKSIQNSRAGYFFLDLNGYFQKVNQAWLDLAGYSSWKEVIGIQYNSHVPTQDQTFKKLVLFSLNGEYTSSEKITFLKKTEELELFLITLSPIIEDNLIVGVEGFLMTIPDSVNLQKIETNLHHSQLQHDHVLRELERLNYAITQHSIMIVSNVNGIIVYINSKFSETSQYQQNEILGKTHQILSSGYHSASFFKNMWDTILSGIVWKGVIRNQKKDGSFYWVETTIIPVLNEKKEVVQFISLRTEVTKLVHSEQRIKKFNQALHRFVPNEFIQFLEKDSILDVSLGDHVEKNMSIVFSDIRSFTAISEKMTPEETFEFINSYLNEMEPIIGKFNGFVDKYIGDGIMAIFPQRPDDALLASIAMITHLNVHNQKSRFPPIKIGIGINTGPLILGIIGSEKRIESTVLSDAVNTAARIEEMTKVVDAPLLISDETYFSLEDPFQFSIRSIGKVKVKGKSKHLVVLEVLDAHPPEIRKQKQAISPNFDLGLAYFSDFEFQTALDYFNQCLEIMPEDRATQYYCQLCSHYIQSDISKELDLPPILIDFFDPQ